MDTIMKLHADSCFSKAQGSRLNHDVMDKEDVIFDFKEVSLFSPAFFVGLIQDTPLENFKKVGSRNLSDLGRKQLIWVMNNFYDDSSKETPFYRAYVSAIGIHFPILYVEGGIVTVMMESGITQLLEKNGELVEIEETKYEDLISTAITIYLKNREQQSSLTSSLQCPSCHKEFDTSINSYRKHVRSCKRGH